MFRDLALTDDDLARLRDAFGGWAEHVRRGVEERGVVFLLEFYAALVLAIDPPGGEATGSWWRDALPDGVVD